MGMWIPISSRCLPEVDKVVQITYLDMRDSERKCDMCGYINDEGYWFDTDNIYLDVLHRLPIAWYLEDSPYIGDIYTPALQEIVDAVSAKRGSSSDDTLVDSERIVESRYINTMRQIFQSYYGIEDYELNELIVEELNL